MLRIETEHQTVRVFLSEICILEHSTDMPALELGQADFHFRSTPGGLQRVSSPVCQRLRLRGCEAKENALRFFEGECSVELQFQRLGNGVRFSLRLPAGWNYVCLSLPAERDEAVYGGGVQFGRLNLRGRRFPMWTSEMGLGRHPLRPYTWLANWIAEAGGEYWNTYFPQPSFLSTRGYGCLIETNQYSALDFSASDRHQVEVLGDVCFHFFASRDLQTLLGSLAKRIGTMPAPPSWVFKGGILGIQGGLPYVRETVDRVLAAGAKLTGIWTQDWTGVRIFWQGKRLFWNWIVNDELYPGLKDEIQRRLEQGIRWLAYINPYFNIEGEYYQVAKKNNYLVKNERGETLVHHVAGFQVGIVDLTNPSAWQWFKEEFLHRNMLSLGLRGWMADYGEDVPEQARFYDGQTGAELHNTYPRLWAQLNREAVEEANLQNEILIFHRSGYSGATRFMNMNWGGDQVVYWNRHDGFPAGVTGGLSGCMSGIQYYHTDAGGYFSFRWIKRNREIFFRWCEANAFSPVLRTHEGNRPWAGVQPWHDDETLRHFAAMTRIRAALAPYLTHVSAEAQQTGVGMMRPFCLTNPGRTWQDKQDAYYLGNDLLVYPVMRPHCKRLSIDIPEGEWQGLFDGRLYRTGRHQVSCPIGKPIVLYRCASPFEPVFQTARREGET